MGQLFQLENQFSVGYSLAVSDLIREDGFAFVGNEFGFIVRLW